MTHSLIVFQGPSASGKSTLQSRLGIPRVTTWTSRSPRDGEVDRVDYFFSTKERMSAMRGEGKFLEMTSYNNELYGTSLESIERIFAGDEKRSVVLDEHGARKLKEMKPGQVLLIGIYADKEDCRVRLASRGTKEADKRLATYDEELRALSQCDLVINNSDSRLSTAEAMIRYIREGLLSDVR